MRNDTVTIGTELAAGQAAGLKMNDLDRNKFEQALTFLAQYGSPAQGKGFFETLAAYLAETLDMDFVCIDRLLGDRQTARTVAVWCDGRFEDNVTYALNDTPCGEVVGNTVCCYPASVCGFFPKDTVLRDLRAESYAEMERMEAEEQIKDLLVEKEFFLNEVQHRIKNHIDTIMTLLELHADSLRMELVESLAKQLRGMVRLERQGGARFVFEFEYQTKGRLR